MALRNMFSKILIPGGIMGVVAHTLWGNVKSDPGTLEGEITYQKRYTLAEKLRVLFLCQLSPVDDLATKDPESLDK